MAREGEVAREDSRHLDKHLARLASCFKKSGDEEGHAVSVEVEYPDGTKDTPRVGHSCRGSCLSHSTFLQCAVRIREEHFLKAFRGRKNFVTSSRWRRSNSASTENSSKQHPFLSRFVRKQGELGLRSTSALQEAERMVNHQVLESLRKQYGPFFGRYSNHLTLGKRIDNGAQGEILEATWRCDDGCEYDVVVKVFDGKCSLEDLQTQLSQGMLKRMTELGFDSYAVHGATLIYRATLLRDGRFAMVMRKYSGDLRNLIERRMDDRVHNEGPPFLDHEAKHLMQEIAKGMDIFHTNDILHRDLKSSNVLFLESANGVPIRCYVADFECNGGVVGTLFYRAPEVLQGVKMGETHKTIKSYQKHSDVYSFGMTCYEICTGLIPLEELPKSDYDSVLEGQRPDLPDYIDSQVRGLIRRCWHPEPSMRPTFGKIVEELDCIVKS